MTTIFSKPNSFNVEIVRENSAISGLEDGKVYLLAARTDLFVDAINFQQDTLLPFQKQQQPLL